MEKKVIIFFILIIFSNYSKIYSQYVADTASYIILDDKEGLLHAGVAIKLDSIRLKIKDNKILEIKEFELFLYNNRILIEKLEFKGANAPNIFKEFNKLFYLDENNIELSADLTHFKIKATVFDNKSNAEYLRHKIVYFFVKR